MLVTLNKESAVLLEVRTDEGDEVDFFQSFIYQLLIFCRVNGLGGGPLHIGKGLFRAYFTSGDIVKVQSWIESNSSKV